MAPPVYSFGEFQLDPGQFALLRNGYAVRLERKPLELLILLAGSEGRLVTRTEIADSLWGKEIFVDTEHGINTAIRKIRAALRDSPERPRYVQTVPRSGYRFMAPIVVHGESTPLPVAESVPEITADSDTSWSGARARRGLIAGLGVAATVFLLGVLAVRLRDRDSARAPEIVYEQLTDLTDAAVAPAISPDGRTLAFVRAGNSFASTGPIYAKGLPNGEDRLVSTDARPKYGLAFSPDGFQIAYTVFEDTFLSTFTVSVFGGEPRLLRTNAAGLSWLNDDQLLYSEVRSGIHLGVVTGSLSGGSTRDVYFPSHQRGMAHYSQASPDRRWILVVEMDGSGDWAPCRVIALRDGHEARTVGPHGACTAAAWSTDGQWMYFTAVVSGKSHLWRQRFPDGDPQQISFGVAEEEGLAMERTGGSLITSVGTTQSALWIHDSRGERALTSEGEVLNESSPPLFRKADTALYYLLRRRAAQTGAELWRAEPRTGKVEPVLSGREMLEYDVSQDGEKILFSAAAQGVTELWLAYTDRSRAPARVGVQGARFPRFAAGGRILFQSSEGNANYLEQADENGLGRSKVVPFPISELQSVSPDGRWALALVPQPPKGLGPAVLAISTDGSSQPVRLCPTYCLPRWASSGRFLFVPVDFSSKTSPGRSLVFRIGKNGGLPNLPPQGLLAPADRTGAKTVARADLVPGTDATQYAFVQQTVQRNLFRVRFR